MDKLGLNVEAFGWLVDPYERVVHIYDTQQEATVFKDFTQPLRGRYFMQDFEVVFNDVLP